MKDKPLFHGSDIERVAKYYNVPADQIVNFASNVNPLGLPGTAKRELTEHLDILTRYPDRDYLSLKETISVYANVPFESIAVGNGSTELISLLIRLQAPKHALVIRPTYSEYERELSLIGAETVPFYLNEENDFRLDPDEFIAALSPEIDMVILCNPNNPTSSCIPLADLEQILAACCRKGIFVMIDETYVEFAPDDAQISALPLVTKYNNFAVLRGVSKFFAAPGLRFGYVVTGSREFLEHIKKEQNPWSLNSVGAFLGEVMLKDRDFIKETRTLINSERERIHHIMINRPDYRLFPSYGNFFLLKLLQDGDTAQDFFEKAIMKHLMIRNCTGMDGLNGEFIRFGILEPEDNDRLLALLD